MPKENLTNSNSEVNINEDELTTLHERSIAMLSYFGFLAIVPFYLKKDSKFCRFHGKQGLMLAIIFYLLQLFTVIDILHDFIILTNVILTVVMSVNALSGRWTKFPLIYKISCELEKTLKLKDDSDSEPMEAEEIISEEKQ